MHQATLSKIKVNYSYWNLKYGQFGICKRLAMLIILINAMFGFVCASDKNSTPNVAPEDFLLKQINAATATYNDVFLKESIMKLLDISPNNERALAALIYLDMRLNNVDQAKSNLVKLKALSPNSESYRKSDLLLALNQPNLRQKLQEARLLAATGKIDQAKNMYDSLFNDMPPTIDFAFEYWRLVSRIPKQNAFAMEKLQRLEAEYPGNTNVRLSLVNMLFKKGQENEAYAILTRMAQQKVTRNDAAKLWEAHLRSLTVTPENLQKWHAFARVYNEAPFYESIKKEIDKQMILLKDPQYQARLRGLDLIDSGEGVKAIADLKLALLKAPDDPTLIGALGMAYMRENRRADALELFKKAKSLDTTGRSGDKWDSLIRSTEYWLSLKEGDTALKSNQLVKALHLYERAHQIKPDGAEAMIGLADVAILQKNTTKAQTYFERALGLDPQNGSAIRGLVKLYESQSPEKALAFLNHLPKSVLQSQKETRNSLRVNIWSNEADILISHNKIEEAIIKLEPAIKIQSDDMWLRYKLAKLYRLKGKNNDADALFADLSKDQLNDPRVIYVYGLYLNGSNRGEQAQILLHTISKNHWSADIHDLSKRIQLAFILDKAVKIRETEGESKAIVYLKNQPNDNKIIALLANWALDRSDFSSAFDYYQMILKDLPDSQDAQLGEIDSLVGLKNNNLAHQKIKNITWLKAASLNTRRRIANIFLQLDDIKNANILFSQLKIEAEKESRGNDSALVLRDIAIFESKVHQPKQALETYKSAMYKSGIAKLPMTDAKEFTRLMRTIEQGDPARNFRILGHKRITEQALDNENSNQNSNNQDGALNDEDWLKRSIRANASDLYVQQNPTLTIGYDYMRLSGTPGISDLKGQTLMLHAEMPFKDGRAFFRTDIVNINEGSFSVKPLDITDGEVYRAAYFENFGTCALGCERDFKQSQKGVSFAIGFENDDWQFDIGTTPLGFQVQNIVGSISYNNKWGDIGWTLTASRRPKPNSLLSFAGAKDPLTQKVWGGAVSNAINLGLSYDQGLTHGVWANLEIAKITGRHIQANQYKHLMAGYYYKLINEDHRRLSIGVSTTVLGYKNDASDYTLGNGGYYSPRVSHSISLPINYRQRTDNWSFEVNGSISRSKSRNSASKKYPLDSNWPSNASTFCVQYSNCNVNESDYSRFLKNQTNSASSGKSNIGYSFQAVVERRLNSNFRLGAGFDYQKSKDYMPSHAFLYLRYSLEPWEGNLDLPPKPPIPYANF